MNVSLRDLRRGDESWLDSWLGACAVSVGYDAIDAEAPARSLLEAIDRGSIRSKVIVAGDPIGIVTYRASAPTAVLEFLGLDSAHARRGYGHAGAALVEQELRAEGVTRIYAPAPAIHGIAVYFWIRLGYRPLLQGDWPCERDGVAWLARDLT